ncbi:MAG: type IV pilin protein, partial [Gallionella sp.]
HLKGNPMERATGFTLVELMVVVAIIGILAGIAVPAYSDYVTRGKLVDATTQLSEGRVKIEQYFQDNRTYDDVSAAIKSPVPDPSKYFTYTPSNRSATTYTITAEGKAELTGFTYSIDQDNVKSSNTPAWGSGTSCWIMRKGDSC